MIRWWNEVKYDVIAFIYVTLIAAAVMYALLVAINAAGSWECNVKTSDMGVSNRYSLVGGCKIEVEDGKWIPLESYYYREGG